MLDIKKRVENLFSLSKDIECIVVIKRSTPNPSFSYITGLTEGLFEGSLVIADRENITLLTSGLDYVKNKDIDVIEVKSEKEFRDTAKDLLSKFNRIGFDGMHTTVHDLKIIKKISERKKMIDVGKNILRCRLKKDDYEIGILKKACKITDEIFEEIIGSVKDGIREKDISLTIEMLAKEKGANGTAFDSIVAFGKNSAIPHHVPSNKRLKRGEIVLLDFGVRYKGYVTDITRSFVYGKTNDRYKRMFEVVMQAQDIGRKSIDYETSFEEVHHKVYSFIEKTPFKGKFIHSTGHTIGLEVHDGFRLNYGSKEKFDDGIVFTIEPGIYLKSLGGMRIEDDFVFINGKVKKLTHSRIFFEI